jgi:hypothetical protein
MPIKDVNSLEIQDSSIMGLDISQSLRANAACTAAGNTLVLLTRRDPDSDAVTATLALMKTDWDKLGILSKRISAVVRDGDGGSFRLRGQAGVTDTTMKVSSRSTNKNLR